LANVSVALDQSWHENVPVAHYSLSLGLPVFLSWSGGPIAFFLWLLVGTPIVCRLFGVSLPVDFRQRKAATRQMSFGQHIWLIGMLGWGIGMFLLGQVDRYFDSRSEGYLGHPASTGRIVGQLAIALAFGIGVGWTTWNSHKTQ
jgi:hypothetical protein